MRGKRCVLAVVVGVLVASLVLPGVASAQEEKYMQAYQAYQEGDFGRAETLFREVCAEYEAAGGWGWCHMMLGATLAQRGASKRQEALDQLQIAAELITEDTERFQTHSAIANVHLLDGRLPQSIASADDASKYAADANQRASLARTRGQAYYRQENWRQAAVELETAVASRSGEANLHGWLGRSYYELGDKAKALQHLTQAAQIDRRHRIGLYFGARVHLENGDFGDAVAMAQRAIQAHPQDTAIRNLLGLALLGADRYADAIQQFEVVIADRPNDAAAIYNLGQAYMATENWPKAIEQFQRAQNLFQAGSSNQGDLLYDLGMAFEKIGRNEDALRAFQDSAAISDTTQVQDSIERVQERIRRAKAK